MLAALLLAALAALLLAAAPAPTNPPVPAPADVVVTGERSTREEAKQRAVAYVDAIGLAPAQRPAARWMDPVCPGARGIAEAYRNFVETRIREIASTASVRLAKPGCRANLIVAFSLDGEALAEAIEQRQPRRRIDWNGADPGMSDELPIRWLYTTETRNADGVPETGLAPIAVDVAVSADGDGGVHSGNTPTNIGTGAARAIRQAVVVVDLNHAEGVKLSAVADFAALVGLAELRRGVPAPRGSVLGVFDDGPAALTPEDALMLRTLYSLPLDRRASQHRGAIVEALSNARSR